jgi:hypothetical protein
MQTVESSICVPLHFVAVSNEPATGDGGSSECSAAMQAINRGTDSRDHPRKPRGHSMLGHGSDYIINAGCSLSNSYPNGALAKNYPSMGASLHLPCLRAGVPFPGRTKKAAEIRGWQVRRTVDTPSKQRLRRVAQPLSKGHASRRLETKGIPVLYITIAPRQQRFLSPDPTPRSVYRSWADNPALRRSEETL